MISKIDGACLLLECFSLSVIVLVIENSIQLGKPSKKDGTTGNGWFNAILSFKFVNLNLSMLCGLLFY